MNKKNFLALFLAVTMIFSNSMPLYASGFADLTQIQGGQGGISEVTSNTIYFGSYKQSWCGTGQWSEAESDEKAKELNYKTEGIQWRVLKNADGKMLLLSDKALYADMFNSDYSRADADTWKNSEVRETLTGSARTGDVGDESSAKEYSTLSASSFVKEAFGKAEYGAIAATDTTTKTYDESSEVVTEDKVFLLPKEDVLGVDDGSGVIIANAYGFDGVLYTPKDTTKSQATEFARSVQKYGNTKVAYADGNGYTVWWLRSPGSDAFDACGVPYSGAVDDDYYVNNAVMRRARL